MYRIKAWIRSFFGFSRGESNAFLILLPLMVMILFSEPMYRHWRGQQPLDFDVRGLDSMMAQLEWDSTAISKEISASLHFSSFDPNTVAEKKLLEMGLSSSLAARVARYRQKGGQFRKKEDLLKIYQFDSVWFEKAKQWMTIESKKEKVKPTFIKKEMVLANRRNARRDLIDINIADSLQLVAVYGIGPVLAKRIQNFRDRLGGFVSLDQVKEVYGLDSLVVNQIKRKFIVIENFFPRTIALNSATVSDMIKHPYVKRSEAQAIVSFRLQHGDFGSLDQLNEIKSLHADWIKKMKPYLVIE